MSPQADYVVSNGTGAAVRSDINGQLAAIVSNNSGASAPATTYAYMLWADTSTNLLKLRNGANSAWITVGDLTAANLGLATLASPTFTGTATIPTLTVSTAANIPLGSAASPTLYFTGDSNTGLYSPGADQVALSTGGTGRLFIDSSGRCGIGSSTPGALLEVKSTDQNPNLYRLYNAYNAGATSWGIDFYRDTDSGNNLSVAEIKAVRTGGNVSELKFGTSSTPGTVVERMRIDSSGRLGIGSTLAGNANNRTLIRSDNTSAITNVLLLNNGLADNYAGTGVRINLSGVSEANSNIRYAYIESATASGSNDHYIAFGTNSPATTPLERARIDSSGRLLVGTSSYSGNASVVIENNSNGTGFGILRINRNTGAPGNGDLLGLITFSDNTTSYSGTIESYRDGGTWSSTSKPTRLVFSTTADGASSPTERMRIRENGNISVSNGITSAFKLAVIEPSGADRSIFLAGVDGVTNGLEVGYLNSGTALRVRFNSITTTASAANAFLDSADGNRLYRSTSSIRYKESIEDIEQNRADAVLGLRPVWYRSKAADDRKDWSWYGLIAEEVAEIEPRLVHWTYLDNAYSTEIIDGEIKKSLKDGAEMVPDGVQYDRLTVLLLDVVKRQQQAIETLEAKVAALESA